MAERMPASNKDEIDLVDVVLSLWERRWLAGGVFLLAAGLMFFWGVRATTVSSAVMKSKYGLALQVGWARKESPSGTVQGGQGSPQETAKWLLDSRFVPQALTTYKSAHPTSDISVSLETPVNTNIVLLMCSDLGGGCRGLLREIVNEFSTANGYLPKDSPFRMVSRVVHVDLVSLVSGARKSVGRKISGSLVIILSVLFGVLCALISVAAVSFYERVRQRVFHKE